MGQNQWRGQNVEATMLATTAQTSEWEALQAQARIALASKFLPKSITTPEQAIAIALAGRELGLPPMVAFRSIHLVDGRVTMSADLMHGLVHQRLPCARLDVVETTNERAVVEAQRAGGKVVTIEFSMADAQRAGLTNRGPWRQYPAAMLRARAISAACRAVFPDVFLGVYTQDELEPQRAPDPVRVEVEAEVVPASPRASIEAIWAAVHRAEDVKPAELATAKLWAQVSREERLELKTIIDEGRRRAGGGE